MAGVTLFPWQALVCDLALQQLASGRWAAFEVALIVARQNGKGTCLEVMELYALFVLGLNVYHTSHLMKTCRKAYKRLWNLIEDTPSLRRRVRGKPHITAEEITVELTSGAFITYMARGQRAGRGLDDCDVLVLDEALFLDPRTVDAVFPTMTTRKYAQCWYASTAAVVGSAMLRRLRARAEANEPGLVYLEWSVPPPTRRRPLRPRDPAMIAMANPSLGTGPDALITLDYCLNEQRALTEEGYARERLGVFDEDPAEANKVIPPAAWEARGGLTVQRPVGEVAFGVAASWPDAEWCSVVVSGGLDPADVAELPEDLADTADDPGEGDRPAPQSVQVIERRRGTSWVIARLLELEEEHDNCGFVIDAAGPAGNLIDDAEAAGLVVHQPTPRDVTHGARDFRAAVGVEVGDVPYLRHYDQDELTEAAEAVGRRPLGDAWTWQRRDDTDVSPIEAASLAAWGFRVHGSVEAWASWG